MKIIEIIIVIIIHLAIPLTGLLSFRRIVRKMKSQDVTDPPTIDLFLVFATYGALLLLVLTILFWKWSGMTSLGAFYLILGAPVVMGIIAIRNYKKKEFSTYHLWTYKAGLLYYAIATATIVLLLILE